MSLCAPEGEFLISAAWAVPTLTAMLTVITAPNRRSPRCACCWHERCFGLACQRWPNHEYSPVYQRILLRSRQDRSLAGRVGRVRLTISANVGHAWRACHGVVPGVFGRRRADAFWRGPAGIFAAAAGRRSADPAATDRTRCGPKVKRIAARRWGRPHHLAAPPG